MQQLIQPVSIDEVSRSFHTAEPFPNFVIDDFLEKDFARDVAGSFPTYSDARSQGVEFASVNEKLKIQVTDSNAFPEPVRKLADAISGPQFLQEMEQITGIPNLLPDPRFTGGGMHMTGPGGRLDVHVDFNIDNVTRLHRRLNILIYFNEDWSSEWGGQLELWDPKVRNCMRSIEPSFNRCAVFATSEKSFHGVQPVRCPTGILRKSFAAYYYTKEAPPDWDGRWHSTVFRARPTEPFRRFVSMPAEKAARGTVNRRGRAKRWLKGLFSP